MCLLKTWTVLWVHVNKKNGYTSANPSLRVYTFHGHVSLFYSSYQVSVYIGLLVDGGFNRSTLRVDKRHFGPH